MKPDLLIPALTLGLFAFSAQAAMSPVPYLGPNTGAKSTAEPNRLTGSNAGKPDNWGVQINPLNPYLSLIPNDLTSPPAQERESPGFLNADPFDPNSVVNSYDRSRYANPFPYDPVYNPYGQGASPYAPRGGANVPMGNGMRYGR